MANARSGSSLRLHQRTLNFSPPLPPLTRPRRVSNEKAQRQLHRLTRKAAALLREPATATLAAAAKQMGFADLQAAQQAAEADVTAAAAADGQPGKRPKRGKKAAEAAAAAAAAAAEAEQALAEPATATAVLAAASSAALSQLDVLPSWAPARGAGSAQAPQQPPLLEGSKYAAQLPRLTRRFAIVAAAAVAGGSAAAGAAAVDELAGEAAGRALELRGDTAKGAKARKKKALTGAAACAAARTPACLHTSLCLGCVGLGSGRVCLSHPHPGLLQPPTPQCFFCHLQPNPTRLLPSSGSCRREPAPLRGAGLAARQPGLVCAAGGRPVAAAGAAGLAGRRRSGAAGGAAGRSCRALLVAGRSLPVEHRGAPAAPVGGERGAVLVLFAARQRGRHWSCLGLGPVQLQRVHSRAPD